MSPNPNEHNYHIFYQMLTGLSPEERGKKQWERGREEIEGGGRWRQMGREGAGREGARREREGGRRMYLQMLTELQNYPELY